MGEEVCEYDVFTSLLVVLRDGIAANEPHSVADTLLSRCLLTGDDYSTVLEGKETKVDQARFIVNCLRSKVKSQPSAIQDIVKAFKLVGLDTLCESIEKGLNRLKDNAARITPLSDTELQPKNEGREPTGEPKPKRMKYENCNEVEDILEPSEEPRIQELQLKVQQSGCRLSLFKLFREPSCDYKSPINENKETLLHVACRLGHLDIVRALIEVFQFGLNIVDKFGNSPCHSACESGQVKILDYFDKCPFSLSYFSKNYSGDTLLHLGCKSGCLPLIRMLLTGPITIPGQHVKLNEYYDEVSIKGVWDLFVHLKSYNKSHHTPLHVALLHGHDHVIRFFIKEYKVSNKSIVPSLITMACVQKNYEMISLLAKGFEYTNVRGSKDSYERNGFFSSAKPFFQEGKLCTIGNPRNTLAQVEPPIFVAVRWGDMELFRKVMQKSDCLSRNSNGDTLFHAACSSGSVEVLRKVYNEIFSIDREECEKLICAHNCLGYTCFHIACELGPVELVTSLMDMNTKAVGLQSKTNEGQTPLHLSILYKRKKVFDILMKSKQRDVNMLNNYRETLLHVAAAEKSLLYYVECILNDASFNSAKQLDNSGETALFNACRIKSSEILKLLLEHDGFDLHLKNKRGDSISSIALRIPWLELFDLIKESQHYSDFNPKYDLCAAYECQERFDGNTKERFTKKDSSGDSLNSFNEQKANVRCNLLSYIKNQPEKYPNFFDSVNELHNGSTLLHRACRDKNIQVFRDILSLKNCDYDTKDSEGNTVLHLCCQYGFEEMAKLCIEVECSLAIMNNAGNTPLHDALIHGHKNKYYVLEYIIKNAKVERLDNYCNSSGENILHTAAAKDISSAILKEIISRRFVSHESKSLKGNTAFHIACRNKSLDNIQVLMKYEYSEKSWYNNQFESPLYVAFSQYEYFLNQLMEYAEIRQFLRSRDFVRKAYFYNETSDASFALFCCYKNRNLKPHCTDNGTCAFSLFPYNEIKKLINEEGVKVIDSKKNTIFHYLAMCKYHPCKAFEAVVTTVFDRHKSLITSLNEYGDTSLHFTCEGRNQWFVKKVLDVGVPPEFINEPGRSGAIVQRYFSLYNFDNPLVHYIVSKGARHNISLPEFTYQDKTTPTLYILVVGDSGVGKTTLINNLKCYTKGEYKLSVSKTSGFVPIKILENGHCYQFYDFAGQMEYSVVQINFLRDLSSSASDCIAPSAFMFLIVVKATENEENLKEQIRRWMYFLQSAAKTVHLKAQVMLLYSHGDYVRPDEGSLLQLEDVMSENCHLHVSDTEICMDCRICDERVADISNTKKLFKKLQEVCSQLETSHLSSLSLALTSVLKHFSNYPCQLHEVVESIKKRTTFSLSGGGEIILSGDHSLLPEIPELLESPLKELHISNCIMLQKPTNDCNNWWIIPKAVQKDLFSKAYSLLSCQDLRHNTGVIPTSKLEMKFKEMEVNFDFSIFLSYLKDMEYCMAIEPALAAQLFVDNADKMELLFFPGFIGSSRNDTVYPIAHKSIFSFFGMLLHTKGRLSLKFLHILLIRLTFQYSQKISNEYDRRISLWVNGIYWSTKNGVEISVEVRNYKDVVILARGSKPENVASHTSSVIQAILDIELNLLERGEQFPPLEKYCLYPIPRDWDSFDESTNRIRIYELMNKFIEMPDNRSHFLQDDGSPPVSFEELLPIDPYVHLKTDILQKLRSSSPYSDNLLQDSQYIQTILKNRSVSSYEELCRILDQHSVFRGKDLANLIGNKSLSEVSANKS